MSADATEHAPGIFESGCHLALLLQVLVGAGIRMRMQPVSVVIRECLNHLLAYCAQFLHLSLVLGEMIEIEERSFEVILGLDCQLCILTLVCEDSGSLLRHLNLLLGHLLCIIVNGD